MSSSSSPTASVRRHPLAATVVLLLALITTGVLYAVVAPGSRAEAAASPRLQTTTVLDEDVISQGRELFITNCSSCHGLDLEGTSDGPHLIGVGAASVDFQVGTGRMPAYTSQAAQIPDTRRVFTQEQIDALAAYVGSVAPGPEVPEPEEYSVEELDAHEIAEGGELFRVNCAMCHGASGAGGALTGGKYAPSLWDSDARYVYEAMLTGPQAMPVFSDGTVPPEEKRMIIAYVESLNEQAGYGGINLGAVGPVSEGAFAWLAGIGGLIGVAIWLGAKSS